MALVFLWSYGSRFGAGASDMWRETCDAKEEGMERSGFTTAVSSVCGLDAVPRLGRHRPPFSPQSSRLVAGIYRSVSPIHQAEGTGKEGWRRKETPEKQKIYGHVSLSTWPAGYPLCPGYGGIGYASRITGFCFSCFFHGRSLFVGRVGFGREQQTEIPSDLSDCFSCMHSTNLAVLKMRA